MVYISKSKKIFDTKLMAVADFALKAIPKTDDTNREHAAVMFERGGKYYYTPIVKGFHATVWPTALRYAVHRRRKYFLHTHPNYGRVDEKGNYIDNNPLSGVPGSNKPGDAFVVDRLGYAGIYLVSAMGNVYLYEGVGSNNTHANDVAEFVRLMPIARGLTKSKHCYRQKSKRDAHYEREIWTP